MDHTSTVGSAATTITIDVLSSAFVQVVPVADLHVVDQDAVLGRPIRETARWTPPPGGLLDAMIGVRAKQPGRWDELLDECARHFATVVCLSREPGKHRCWLVMVSGAPDADSRLRRHLGLRREREGLEGRLGVPAGAWSRDVTLSAGEQLRFATAVEVSSLEAAATVVSQERLTHVMYFTARDLRDETTMKELLDMAWPDLETEPSSLPRWSRLLRACPAGDVVVRPVGDFDDLERRLDLVGTETALRSLLTGRGEQALRAMTAVQGPGH